MTILEAIKSGRKVQTKNGQKVRVICTDKKGDCPIVALVGEDEICVLYDKDGLDSCAGCCGCKGLDLVVIPEKKTLWFNIYQNPDGYIFSGISHDSLEEAKQNIDKSSIDIYICTKSIEIY